MQQFAQILFLFIGLTCFGQTNFKTPNKFNMKGQKVGQWSERWNDDVFVGEYVNGQKQGSWVNKDYKGRIAEIFTYRNDTLQGDYVKLRNGVLHIQGRYSKGKKSGVWKTFSEYLVLLKSANYKNGQLNGKYTAYHSSGEIMELTNYEDNLRIGESIWYNQQGFVIARYKYKKGKKHGKQYEYFPKGNVKTRYTYKAGQQHGKYEEYYENGKIKLKGKYENGKKMGVWISYDENGKKTNDEIYFEF